MQGLGAKLRKLPGQAKICTPPGGEVIAKICVLRSKDLYSRRDFATDASYGLGPRLRGCRVRGVATHVRDVRRPRELDHGPAVEPTTATTCVHLGLSALYRAGANRLSIVNSRYTIKHHALTKLFPTNVLALSVRAHASTHAQSPHRSAQSAQQDLQRYRPPGRRSMPLRRSAAGPCSR